ncbi:hypothetical protein BDC45DRAFT_126642 [Circinella umbellata]|nr:hypothetical protein BDC45DRAFT_126642 [Circinella umbellata]
MIMIARRNILNEVAQNFHTSRVFFFFYLQVLKTFKSIMSFPRSPGPVNDPVNNGRWAVDNSESPFASMSPRQSILKSGSPYNSPASSRFERQSRRARHVSFSPFDRIS